MRNIYIKGFLIFFILSIILNVYRVYQLEYILVFFDLFHFLPTLIFNEMIDGIFPNYPDFLDLIPIALSDGLLGVITVLCIKRFATKTLNNKGIFYFNNFLSFCVTQWLIYNYVPIFQP